VQQALLLDRLTARYGPIEALRAVSLSVDEGEIVTVVGPNGAGKSTMMSAVMGLVRPSGGSVRLYGEDITRMEPENVVKRGVSLVPERRRIFKNLTVRENLRLGAATRRDREATEADQEELLELFPVLRSRMGQLAGFLSGGEAQQLAIARAVMSRPRLLLLDEPSLGLAPRLVEALFGLIRRLRERGHTILLVEQNATQALEIADRGYLISNGRIEHESRAGGVRDEQELMRSYLGLRGGSN
jgi:branched-chain amino acid transport system ATP-binding protein